MRPPSAPDGTAVTGARAEELLLRLLAEQPALELSFGGNVKQTKEKQAKEKEKQGKEKEKQGKEKQKDKQGKEKDKQGKDGKDTDGKKDHNHFAPKQSAE